MGKVYLIGAGPGDPRLITAYGKDILQKADCVIYDRLIGDELLNLAKTDCEKIYVGKKCKAHTVLQADIEKLLFEKSKQYDIVVRLKGGDPFVFGRGAEEALFLSQREIEVEIVPGVTSAISALTYAGIPITHRGVSKGFRVITAHSKDDIMSNIDFSSMLPDDETYVFLMGLHHLSEIAQKLISVGKNPNTPCAVISNATTAKQKKCIAPLSKIAKEAENCALTSPATIVVGNVVELSNMLPCYENKPLFSKRIFVPYIEGVKFSFSDGLQHKKENELINSLRELGAYVVPYHAGTIKALEFDKRLLSSGDALAFSSQNAVYSFMSQITDVRNVPKLPIAVVGEKTKKALNELGFTVDFVANTAQELSLFLKDKRSVLHFCAKDNAYTLGDNCIQIPCYKNVATDENISDISQLDAAVFTCGSNAQRTINNTLSPLPKTIFSIGESTSSVLYKNEIQNVITSDEPNIKSLVGKILTLLKH